MCRQREPLKSWWHTSKSQPGKKKKGIKFTLIKAKLVCIHHLCLTWTSWWSQKWSQLFFFFLSILLINYITMLHCTELQTHVTTLCNPPGLNHNHGQDTHLSWALGADSQPAPITQPQLLSVPSQGEKRNEKPQTPSLEANTGTAVLNIAVLGESACITLSSAAEVCCVCYQQADLRLPTLLLY